MKIVITGSRTIRDYDIVKFCLENSPYNLKESILLTGGCRGSKVDGKWDSAPSVDELAVQWAKENDIKYTEYFPEWYPNGVYDNQAALKRDELMVQIAARAYGGLIGIWDGFSRGTDYTIRMAEKYEIDYVYWLII